MITLLILAQATVTVSDADRTAFADYRKCILAEVEKAPRDAGVDAALKEAHVACHDDETASGLDMAGEDLEREADGGKRPKFKVEQRLAAMEGELTAEAKALFAQEKTDP